MVQKIYKKEKEKVIVQTETVTDEINMICNPRAPIKNFVLIHADNIICKSYHIKYIQKDTVSYVSILG